MSERAPLDVAELLRRARQHAGVEASATPVEPSVGTGAEKLLIDAATYHPAWKLSPGARLQALRKAAVAPLSAYTDRQNQLDADLLAAFASLLVDCQALEARVVALEAEVARLAESTGAAAREDAGAGRS